MEEIKTIGGHQLPQGADGGHYTPVITQPTADTMMVEFRPSKTGMVAVEPVKIRLPVGSGDGSGQNVTLDTTLTQSGKAADAKAVGDKLAELEAKIPEGGSNYTLPVANTSTLGGVKLPPKTDAHTEQATVGADGRVWVKPPSQSVSEVGGVEFTNYVGNLWSGVIYTRIPNVGEPVSAGTGQARNCTVIRAKPGTKYVVTASSLTTANWGQADGAGICTQVPVAVGTSGCPVSLEKPGFVASGGLGKYFVISTNADFREDTAYLVWWGTPTENVIIYEGDSIEGYDAVAPYGPLNGVSTSDGLMVQRRNLAEDINESLQNADTAVQPEDFTPEKLTYSPHHVSDVVRGEVNLVPHFSYLGDITNQINSIELAAQIMRSQTRLDEIYAHCPSVSIKDGIAYICAFQNSTGEDTYYIPEASTQLYIVDTTTMTKLAQHRVAGNGDTVDGLTFATGSGATQGVLVNDDTLRIVFCALLRNDAGEDDWYQCYRDYNISTGEFGPIGLCQILDVDGNAHVFRTATVSAYIKAIPGYTDPNWGGYKPTDTGWPGTNNNVVCQPAKIGNAWYVALGARDKWANMPILNTTDWIKFGLWADPVLDGNDAHYEAALTNRGNILVMATRQKDGDYLLLAKIDASTKTVLSTFKLPTGNKTRPYLILSGDYLYVYHILTASRSGSGHCTVIQFNTWRQQHAMSLPPMIYPTIVDCGTGWFAAYLGRFGLTMAKFSALEPYSEPECIAMGKRLIELLNGK